MLMRLLAGTALAALLAGPALAELTFEEAADLTDCLLYTSDAADE